MTTFGKKTSQGPMPAAKPTFGKKPTSAPVGRAAPAANRMSPEAMAFLQSERERKPAAPAAPAKASKPAYAAPSSQPAGDLGLGKPVWGRRVLARLVDEFGVWFLIFLVFRDGLSAATSTYITAGAGTPAENAAALELLGYGVIFMLIQSAYNIAMESSSTQATLGKMLVGAQVTARDGSKPGLGAVIMRNTFGRFVVNVVPFYAGYLMGLFNAERRCLHDMMSNTVVRRRAPGGAPASYGEVFA